MPPQPPEETRPARRDVRFKMFQAGVMTTWEDLFGEAAAFASSLPPGALINLSHSDSHKVGIVVVWYWAD